MKTYRKSPLPFLGQKYRMLNSIDSAIEKIPTADTVVDLFGGSGLLAHYIKRKRPDLRVIYNDFDGFAMRLSAIPETNAHIEHLKTLIIAAPNERVNEVEKSVVMQYLEQQTTDGYVDLVTIASSIQFGGKNSGTLEQIRKNSMYNSFRKRPYSAATDYLDELEVVNGCALELIDEYIDAVFVVGPPYLDTHNAPYSGEFILEDHAKLLKKLEGERFIYFSGQPDVVLNLSSELGFSALSEADRSRRETTYNRHATVTDGLFIRINK